MDRIIVLAFFSCVLFFIILLCIQKSFRTKRMENEAAERKFQETLKELERKSLSPL